MEVNRSDLDFFYLSTSRGMPHTYKTGGKQRGFTLRFFQMGPQPTKHLSKKAKRKLANSQLQQSTISAHMPGEKNKINV